MKSSRRLLALSLMCGLGLAVLLVPGVAQEAEPAAEKRVGDDETGQLPPGYTTIVKQSQRKRIYAIQADYAKQIEEVRKQILALEAKRDAEIRNVLTDEQKQILALILKLREEERQENAKASTSAAATAPAN